MMLGYWEFNGKRSRPPKGLVYNKRGGLDLRFRKNKIFIKDGRWKYRNPLAEMFAKAFIERIFEPTLFEMLHKNKATTIRFRRFAELDNKVEKITSLV